MSLRDIYRERETHADMFDLAERLIDWDQRLVLWRTMHLKLVVLGRRLDVRYFQPRWDIRNALTEEAGTSPR